MKFDSYTRFLKSDLYKSYLMREIAGETIALSSESVDPDLLVSSPASKMKNLKVSRVIGKFFENSKDFFGNLTYFCVLQIGSLTIGPSRVPGLGLFGLLSSIFILDPFRLVLPGSQDSSSPAYCPLYLYKIHSGSSFQVHKTRTLWLTAPLIIPADYLVSPASLSGAKIPLASLFFYLVGSIRILLLDIYTYIYRHFLLYCTTFPAWRWFYSPILGSVCLRLAYPVRNSTSRFRGSCISAL